MNVSTQPKIYTGSPTVYANSSMMSPDRREFYLSHKTGIRKVFQLSEDVVVAATKDPRFPIDMCCLHDFAEAPAFVCFSSKMITVAKVQSLAEDDHARLMKTFTACLAAVENSPHRLTEQEAKLLPRRKGQRAQSAYGRIPLSSDGKVLLSSEHYPITSATTPTDSLNTAMWYVWLAIIFETGSPVKTARTTFTEDNTNYFVLQNNYHTVIEKLP